MTERVDLSTIKMSDDMLKSVKRASRGYSVILSKDGIDQAVLISSDTFEAVRRLGFQMFEQFPILAFQEPPAVLSAIDPAYGNT